MSRDYILERCGERKNLIQQRLRELKGTIKMDDRRIFQELAFCICVPQSRAVYAWQAVEKMATSQLLFKGTAKQLAAEMRGLVRFHNTKARWIYKTRKLFTKNGQIKIKQRLRAFETPQQLREWLVNNVPGIGYKLAGHFMRNTGLCQSLAILDVHILNNLERLGVAERPKSLTPKKYLEIEEKMSRFSQEIGIPMEELDLLFWSEETGHVFK